MPTDSEAAFMSHCRSRGIECSRLIPDGRKTPDFVITLGRHRVLVEVKELEPNLDEQAGEADLRQHGYTPKPVMLTPNRMRGTIRKANGQLKAKARPGQACLCVFWTGMMSSDSYFSESSMFGVMFGKVVYATRTKTLHMGGGRTLHENANTTISAVGVMKRSEFVAFHNPFTACPIDPGELERLADRQYRPELDERGHPVPGWVAVP